jgi:hypothetical protein
MCVVMMQVVWISETSVNFETTRDAISHKAIILGSLHVSVEHKSSLNVRTI